MSGDEGHEATLRVLDELIAEVRNGLAASARERRQKAQRCREQNQGTVEARHGRAGELAQQLLAKLVKEQGCAALSDTGLTRLAQLHQAHEVPSSAP